MKKGILIFGAFIVSLSFVSALPKDFEVSNVYWASEGAIDNKPFLLGLVELSWQGAKGKTNSLIVYLDYSGEKFYSHSLGFIKDLSQLDKGIVEAQFYPLKTFAQEKIGDKIAKYSLVIPIMLDGKIKFEEARFAKLDADLVIPDSQRTKDSDSAQLFSHLEGAVVCSKSILFESSSVEMCDDDTMSYEEFNQCREANQKIESIAFDCSILCSKKFYKESLNTENKNFNYCSIYVMNFRRVTSSSLDFNQLAQLNKGLELFNPWRAGP